MKNPAMPEAVDIESDESPLPEAANETLSPDLDVPTEAWLQQELTPPTKAAAVIVQSKPENSPSDVNTL